MVLHVSQPSSDLVAIRIIILIMRCGSEIEGGRRRGRSAAKSNNLNRDDITYQVNRLMHDVKSWSYSLWAGTEKEKGAATGSRHDRDGELTHEYANLKMKMEKCRWN